MGQILLTIPCSVCSAEDKITRMAESRNPVAEQTPIQAGPRTAKVPGQLQATPRFSTLSASSSGYHSLDISLPNSPFMTHNKSTQTPSPSNHLVCIYLSSVTRTLSMLPDMRPEMLVARELRRIGDKFNDIYINGVSILLCPHCPLRPTAMGQGATLTPYPGDNKNKESPLRSRSSWLHVRMGEVEQQEIV
uniref:Bcl-x interacting BH3 domain-containing protein n=1 Tax=Paramormyrops kingsleyae TaxID=1676925 RepID=A0A3B3QC78_9TELE